MNNFEKIKAMNLDEMAEFFSFGMYPKCCGICIGGNGGNCLIQVSCQSGIKSWLESEVRE